MNILCRSDKTVDSRCVPEDYKHDHMQETEEHLYEDDLPRMVGRWPLQKNINVKLLNIGRLVQLLRQCYWCGRSLVRFLSRLNRIQCRQRLATAATFLRR